MTIPIISTLICNHFNIEKSELRGTSRVFADARKWFYYLCKTNGLKEQRIAGYIRRDRSTINKVFNDLNRRIDKHKNLQTIKEKLTGEKTVN